MEMIKENSFAKAKYDSATAVIYSEYSGTVNVEKALEVLGAQVEYAHNHQVKAILADLSGLKGTFTMINEWLETNFYPVLIEKGLICNALIVSPDIFSLFAIKDLLKRVGNFELQTFKSFEEGEQWIQEKLKN